MGGKRKKLTSSSGRDKELDVIIGANVKRYRTQRGISQEKLGTLLGPGEAVTFQQVQKYEKGTNSIAACRVPYLIQALGITLEQLFEGTLLNPRGAKVQPVHQLSQRAIRFAESFDKLDDRVAGTIVTMVDAVGEVAHK